MQEQLFDGAGTNTISNRAFAEMVGVTEGAIRKAITEGKFSEAAFVILPDGRRKLQPEEALRQWQQLHGEQPVTADDGDNTFAYHNTRLAKEKADRAAMENAEMRGELHRAEDVREVMGNMLAAFRSRIRALPAKLADRLAGITDPAEIKRILTAETDEALQELSEYDPHQFRAKRRRRQAASAAPETE